MSSEVAEAMSPEGMGVHPDRQVLVLDLSRSMLAPLPDSSGGSPRQKIEIARSAVLRIVQNAEKAGTPFGLVTFTDTPRVVVPLGEIRPENLPYVKSLVDMLTPTGRSAIWDALATGADLLRDASGAVHGTIVLVTDGWDNCSTRFEPLGADANPTPLSRKDLFGYLLPPGSNLNLRVIGIGNGAQRDKGVDSDRMNLFVSGLSSRALFLGAAPSFSYEEVDTGADLYTQMVNAFVDVEDAPRPAVSNLHPEDLAKSAAQAARALKQSEEHSAIHRIARTSTPPLEADMPYSEAPTLEVDVLSASQAPPANLRERYGPLARVVESYLKRDFTKASGELNRCRMSLPPVTYSYWQAKIAFGNGDVVEAARALIIAWSATESIPIQSRIRVTRRLALLQAQMQKDPETEILLQFVEETEAKIRSAPPEMQTRIMDLFERLMELRGTYQLTRIPGAEDPAVAAQKHEGAVEEIFGLLQDIRLDNTAGDAAIDGALDFLEICLAEMR
ncbi:MAG: VWA domain-containing protein [Thermoplasmata archaeon]|nr:VWA domain-containing protein [Thermoplasmata archaeon]MCI4358928.1 VWA domain-containing protein [Thermoplasmata archaeon]